jgi:hypothetical protein
MANTTHEGPWINLIATYSIHVSHFVGEGCKLKDKF